MASEYSERQDTLTRLSENYSTRNIRLVSFEELDEENVNWGILCTRVLAIVMLISIIVCFSIGAIYEQFLMIAGIASGFLIAVLCLSFVDLKCLRSSYRNSYKSHQELLLAPDEEVEDNSP